MNMLLLALVAALPSVGDVKLECKDPGPWTFEMSVEKASDGADVVRVRMKSAAEAVPPKFALKWFVSQRGVHHVWSSESTHYGIPWGEVRISELTSFLPLYAFIGTDDRNRFTFACSESCRRVEFRSPVSETGMGLNCSYTFFTVPEAPMRAYEVAVRVDARDVFYGQAVGDAADWMCRTAGVVPMAAPDAAFDALYSSWYTFHQDVSAELVEEECALAAKLGMRTVIVDDGWQIDLPLGNRPWGGYRLCGDWRAGRNFPDMAAHVKRVQDLGFKYMLWYSVPFVGEKSANYARFKGKCLPVSCAGGWVLDPRFPEVREFITRTYEDAIRNWNLDGLKLDFIGRFTLKEGVEDPAVRENYAGRDIKSIPLAVDALLTGVMTRLKALKPDILIEFRQPYIGPSIRRFGNMLRASDCPLSMVENRTRIARIRLTAGRTAVHADMLEWRFDETPESAALNVLNSIFGVVQYSVRLKNLPEAHRRMLAHWIGFAEAHKDALVKGEFRPRHPASDYPLLEGESAAERVIGVYQSGLSAPVGAADRPVWVLNATPGGTLIVDLPRRPAKAEVFDTFGAAKGTPSLSAGVNAVAVPPSGCLKLTWNDEPRAAAADEYATPESQGVSSRAILRWIDACERRLDDIHGFVLRRHGKIIAEGSWRPYDTLNETHMLYSHSKSFTSTAIGFLVDDGKVDLDERVVSIFPDKAPANPSENLRQMRVRDLLTMNVGADYTDAERKDLGGDWVRLFLGNEIQHEPGTRFKYDSCATHVLAAIAERRSGMKLMDFLNERLFRPIGIEKAWSTTSPDGIACGGWGMNMTTRELSRFGQFCMNDGVWDGRRLLSKEWLDMARARQTWSGAIRVSSETLGSGSDWAQGYGFQFWRCRHGAWRCDGAYGQYTIGLPEQDATISIHAGLSSMQDEINTVWEHLLPAMGEGPLPDDPAADELKARCRALEIPAVAGTRADADVFGRDYRLKDGNRHHITAIRVDSAQEGWTCALTTQSGVQRFPIGFGRWAEGRAGFDTVGYEGLMALIGEHVVRSSGAVQADGSFRGCIRLTGTPGRIEFTLRPDGTLAGQVRFIGAFKFEGAAVR